MILMVVEVALEMTVELVEVKEEEDQQLYLMETKF